MLFIALTTLANTVSTFSQETSQRTAPEHSGEASREFAPEPPPETENPEDVIYYIRSINFNIDGLTRVFALLDLLEMKEGQRINGRAALETLVRRKTQILHNQRVLEEEGCRIDYAVGEAEDGSAVPVDFLVHVKDAWNIFAFPEPKYDSNTGLSITLKARDWNFLGTMSPLELDLGYEIDEYQYSVFADLDADIPFRFLGYIWNFNFDNAFTYNEFDPNYYKNVTGLTLNLPWKQTTVTVGFDQSFFLNEKNSDEEKIETGVEFYENKWYMSSELYAQWEIPLGIEVGDFGTLTYVPRLTEDFNYRPGGHIGEYRRGPATKFEHSFGFGQINWLGNFRSGLAASISNVNTFNNYTMNWDCNAGLAVEGHIDLTSFFGASGRLKYRKYFSSDNYSVGADLRGIRDKDFIADNVLSFNLELPLRILSFTPSRWFNRRYFRPFDVEVHFSPFVDIALINGRTNPEYRTAGTYAFGEPLVAAGFEVIAFSRPWRNLNLRASLGWDLQEWSRSGKAPGGHYQELYIGLHHFY
ncbi:MAG: hypothetical protein LBG14_00490 [Treponema sp.]|nr:hypothetical protein [Treponema sp.]